MKARTIALTLALCFVAVAVGFASNPNMGTWKLRNNHPLSHLEAALAGDKR
jgi:hypothetical protein